MAVIRIENEALTATIDTRGAELLSIRTADRSEWMWQGRAAEWSGRAPILFPVIGRSPNERVSIDGRSYPMPLHGFAHASAFSVEEETPVSCRLRLEDSQATRISFPFAFRLDLTFGLEGGVLRAVAEITNRDSAVMPCSFGFHPAFAWPLPGGEGAPHAVTLAAGTEPATRRINEEKMMAPAAEPSLFRRGRLELLPELFVRNAVMLADGWGGAIRFGVDDGPNILVAARGLPQLGLWMLPGSAFLCIEPWHGLPPLAGAGDDLRRRPGIMQLEPGECRTLEMTIEPGGRG